MNKYGTNIDYNTQGNCENVMHLAFWGIRIEYNFTKSNSGWLAFQKWYESAWGVLAWTTMEGWKAGAYLFSTDK